MEKFELVFVKMLFLRGFILKPTKTAHILLKAGARDFQNIPSSERLVYFYVAITGNLECFQYLNFETNFLKPFSKNWGNFSSLKVLRFKTQHFHAKLPFQKPMLRQLEWEIQNGPIKKNGVLPVTASFI